MYANLTPRGATTNTKFEGRAHTPAHAVALAYLAALEGRPA